MVYKSLNDGYLVRLERGEELIASIAKFARSLHIQGAFFHGLGGAEYAEIGIYRLDSDKQYHFKQFDEALEIISMNGNIARNADDEVMIHCHAAISGRDLLTYGGHVKQLRVGGTCEIMIDLRTKELKRVHDNDIGLELLDLK